MTFISIQEYHSVETETSCPYLRLHRYEKNDMVYMMAFNEDFAAKGEHTLKIECANTLDKRHMDLISSAQEIQPSGVLGPIAIRTSSV